MYETEDSLSWDSLRIQLTPLGCVYVSNKASKR